MSISWPGGARCAVAFTFDFDAEEVWIADDPANEHRPGVLSQGTYGAKVAVPEILKLLDRHGVRSTFFVPGRVAERHEGRVREIVAAGHELGLHGYTHRSPVGMSRDEEEDELRRSKQILEGFGVAVTGYRSPAWEFSASTIDLLAAHGVGYSSNFMDDVVPYRHQQGVVELPVQWMLDDAAHFWFSSASWDRTIATTEHVRSIWTAELEGIRRLGGACIFTMHPQVIGRPSRLAFLDELIGHARALDDVWVASCEEIAAAVPASEFPHGPLAQLVEQGTFNPKVAGSIPARPTRLARWLGR